MARLGLARAYALQLEANGIHASHPALLARAQSAYQDFFTLWKDADPDIPVLREARAEFSRLK
jgi:hypothetical protein